MMALLMPGSRAAAPSRAQVTNCSFNIRPIEARELSLPPQEMQAVLPPMQLFVEDNDEAPERHCWLHLYDAVVRAPPPRRASKPPWHASRCIGLLTCCGTLGQHAALPPPAAARAAAARCAQGEVTDTSMMRFFTNATVFDEQPTGGFNGTGDGPGSGSRAVDCDKVGGLWACVCVRVCGWHPLGACAYACGGARACVCEGGRVWAAAESWGRLSVGSQWRPRLAQPPSKSGAKARAAQPWRARAAPRAAGVQERI